MQGLQLDRRLCWRWVAAEHVGRSREQLVLPVGDLVGVHVMLLPNSASVLSPRTAASATLALNAAECVLRGLLLIFVRISAKVTDDFGNVTGLSGRC